MLALDDAVNGVHNPEQGAKNVQAFIADPAVLAMVGPFNSNVARAEMPIVNQAGLAQISPANTAETLTKPEYGQTGTYRPTGKITYFRVCTTDDIQGPSAADYMYDKLNVKNIYILDDTETYGKGLADNVEKRFKANGGTVVGHEGVPKGTSDFRTIMTKIAGLTPKVDALFYGGTTSNGLALARKQMADAGLTIPFMGGDGIVEAEFTKVAQDAANGSYGTVAAVNAATLPEAAKFLADYKAKYNEEVGAYSANAYEATNIIIAAMKRATAADREAVRAAIAATKDYKGVIGTTSFDENGDTTNRWISIYEVKDAKWTFVDQIQFGVSGGTTGGTTPGAGATPEMTGGVKLKVTKVGLVTDVGSVNDKSFNQSSWEGAQQGAKALGAESKYIETKDPKDYGTNIDELVSEGYNPIVTVGFALGEATAAAAAKHPDTYFIGVDQFIDPSTDAGKLTNYAGLIFDEDKSGFLAGALAAQVSKAGNIGAVLATDTVPPVWRFGEGFKAGAMYVNKDIKIQAVYHSDVDLGKTFNDPAWGKTTAISMIDKGADVIFAAGGTTGNGALQAAAERQGIYAIGVDTDQYFTVPEAKSALLSSAMKLLTPGVANLIQALNDGTFHGGNNVGEVGLAPFHDLESAVSQQVKDKLAEIDKGLKDGTIKTGVAPVKP
jgi:basic membrane protein A